MAVLAAAPAAARSFRTEAPLVTVRRPIMTTMLAATRTDALIQRGNARSSWFGKPVFVMVSLHRYSPSDVETIADGWGAGCEPGHTGVFFVLLGFLPN